MPCVYLLHLDTPLAHARHYAGCAASLYHRLVEHATGQGSRLTRVLFDLGIEWQLGSAHYIKPDLATARQVERILKDQHHAPRYCRLCSGYKTLRLAYAIELPLADLDFPLDSRSIRARHQTTPAHDEQHSPERSTDE